MVDALKDFFEASSIIDLIYIAITIWSLISCYRKGFVLSILSMAKWLLAYIITLILFPRIKPYVEDIIDNEYVLDVGLGIAIFIVVIFLVLLVNKGISKAVKYTGIGGLDTTFGFFFGFVKAYIISVCIFSGIHIVYNHDKWPINLDKSYTFPYLEKGSNYLIKEFPNEKTYQESKEKLYHLRYRDNCTINCKIQKRKKLLIRLLMQFFKFKVVTLVMLTQNSLVGVRDPFGIRPLVIGKLKNSYVLASETCALDIIGAKFIREVENGEIVLIENDTLKSIKPFPPKKVRPCVFEYILCKTR